MNVPSPAAMKPVALRRSGFSLTELLVVVAVIAILAALLLTISGKARASASNAGCLSKLRSLHTAAMTWVADNNWRMPDAVFWQDDSGNNVRRRYQLAPYLISNFVPGEEAPDLSAQHSPFTCEAAHNMQPSSSDWGRTFSINGYATSTSENSARNPLYYPPSLQAIALPASMAFFMDGAPQGGGSYRSNVTEGHVGSALNYPHNRGINVIFVDGHVSRFTQKEMTESYSELSSFWRYNF